MVSVAVQVSCEYSLLASQQNNYNLSLNSQDDLFIRFYQMISTIWETIWLKSTKAKVYNLLAIELHQ